MQDQQHEEADQSKGASLWNGHFKRIRTEPTGIPQQEWINSVPNDGLIHYRSLLNVERLMPTSPQALAEVLSHKSYEFAKPATLRHGLGRILGGGLVIAEGDEHRVQRKNLMPAFAFRHVKDLYPTFWEKSCKLVKNLMSDIRERSDELAKSSLATVEISNWTSRATLDIIGTAGFGKDFNALDDPETELNVTYRKVLQPSRAAQTLSFMGLVLPPWLVQAIPIAQNSKITDAAESIKRVARQLIHEKKVKLSVAGKRTEPDILSVAIESGGFSDEDLVNQLMTFLAAGHETTATAMTWAIYLLCKHLEVQTKLREEVRSILPSPDTNDPLLPQTLESCSYLYAVCNEVLRVYAPVPILIREAVHDTTLMGHQVPKGTKILNCPWAVNTSVALWGPDAAEFKPDRWVGPGKANNAGAQSNYAFLTFLHGPRSCIGQAFAKAEFACLLAALVGRLDFQLKDTEMKIEIKGGITARPRDGLNVLMKPLDGW